MISIHKHYNVLLADDDNDDRKFFADALEELKVPCKLTDIPDCVELLAIISKESKPDIIFLDLNMPNLSGLECLQEIRQNKRFDDVPVAIYSTSSNRKDIVRSYNGGANMYVVKPNRFDEIVNILQNIFSTDLKNYLIVPPMEKFVVNQ